MELIEIAHRRQCLRAETGRDQLIDARERLLARAKSSERILELIGQRFHLLLHRHRVEAQTFDPTEIGFFFFGELIGRSLLLLLLFLPLGISAACFVGFPFRLCFCEFLHGGAFQRPLLLDPGSCAGQVASRGILLKGCAL